ncbi:MAG: O-antigen ligase domain-containing protein [Hyphomicrobiales bacterium]|nr:O-antigen ligase domain-containing protein [Hyphomicrobiales bacterium]
MATREPILGVMGTPWALDALLATGLVLSTTSQLRLGGGIGPAEICLALWVLAMAAREAIRLGPPLSPALSRLLIFWGLFTAAQCIGTLAGMAIGDRHDTSLFLHDALAYPLLGAISVLSVVEPGARPRLERTAWLVGIFGAVTLALQLANAAGLINFLGADPWYWDRMRGWSENPNQLALFCAAHALLCLHLAESASETGARICAIVCGALSIIVGRLSKSDTFSLVLVTAVPVFLAFKFRVWLLSLGPLLTLRAAGAWIAIIGFPILLLSAAPLAYSLANQAEGIAKELSKDNGKDTQNEADLRFSSWKDAFARGLESGMLGLGPGPHLQIPAILVAARQTENGPKNIEHPEANAAPNFEAHDTVLDLFTQGGLLAVLSFVWIAASTFVVTFKGRLAGLSTLLFGLGIFAIFHLIVRQPLFWFAISLCLVAGLEAAKPAPMRLRSS